MPPDGKDKSKTIIRVITKRFGKRGAPGSTTNMYEVAEHGDPVAGSTSATVKFRV